jgi:two-component system response regulator FixJ
MVFVVDDDDDLREILRQMLLDRDFDVRAFDSGNAFLNSLDAAATGCVLLDVRMQGMSGLQVLEQLSARRDALPVIMMTGFGEVPLAVSAMKTGAVDFIEKPFKAEKIVEAVNRAMELSATKRENVTALERIASRLDMLTPRERDVLDQLVLGRPNKLIAHELGISPRTVEIHRSRVMHKMQAESLPHLVKMAMTVGTNSA